MLRGSARSPQRMHSLCIARVAVAADPPVLDRLTEVLEEEARPASRTLAVAHHRTKLRVVLLAPRLVVGEVRAQVHRCEPTLQPLPPTAAMLAHEAVSLQQTEDDARLPPRHT